MKRVFCILVTALTLFALLFACAAEKKPAEMTAKEFSALYQSAMEKSVYFSPYASFAGIGDNAPEAIEKGKDAVAGYAAIWTVERDRKTDVSTREKMLAWLEETFTHEAAESLLSSEAEPGVPWIKEEGGVLYRLIKRETKTVPQIGEIDVSVLSQTGSEGEVEATIHALTSFSDRDFSLALRCRVSRDDAGWRISGDYGEPTSRFVQEWEKRSVYQPVGISENDFMLLIQLASQLIDQNNEISVSRNRPSSIDPSLEDLPEEKTFGENAYRLCYNTPTREALLTVLQRCFSKELALEYMNGTREGVALFQEWEGHLYVLAKEKKQPDLTVACYYQRIEDKKDNMLFRVFLTERGKEDFAGYIEVEGKRLDDKWIFTKYTNPAYCLAHPEMLLTP